MGNLAVCLLAGSRIGPGARSVKLLEGSRSHANATTTTTTPKIDIRACSDALDWNAREMPPACTCHLKVFTITGLGLQQEGLLKHSVPIYAWIFENGAHVRTATLTVFQKITEDFSFNQPKTVCQHTAYSPTSLVSGLLASSH